MKMAGSNILTRKQLEKMTIEHLIDFAMKLQDNLISKQTELINGNKEFRGKLNVTEVKFDDRKKENETLQSKVMIAEKISTKLSMNHKKLNNKAIEMERNMHRLDQYSRRECIEIAGVPNSITNNLLEEYVILIFEKLGVVIEAMDIVVCHRLGGIGRVIVKLLNRKDAQNVLAEKHKLRSINFYDDNTNTNNKRKIFINQSLCPYYRKLYGMVKDLNKEGLIDSFWIANGTIKIRESSRWKPISITHEFDLQF